MGVGGQFLLSAVLGTVSTTCHSQLCSGGSGFSAGHEGKSRLPKTQQDRELLKYSVNAQVMGETT